MKTLNPNKFCIWCQTMRWNPLDLTKYKRYTILIIITENMLNLNFISFRYTYLVLFLSDTQSSQVVIG